jgi:hypothetical protein
MSNLPSEPEFEQAYKGTLHLRLHSFSITSLFPRLHLYEFELLLS